MTRLSILLAAVLLCFAPAASAQSLDLSEVEAFFDEEFSALLESTGIPGATLAVVTADGTILTKGYGIADIETGAPVDPDTTLFRIGSITKLFTAIAALQLVDSGDLDLHADVNGYLSGIQVSATYPEPVTAAHILTHQSGFDSDISFLTGERFWIEAMPSDEVERRLARMYPPGRIASYDNMGFALLGPVIEGAADTPYADVVRDKIFSPLGMDRSLVDMAKGDISTLAGCHVFRGPGLVRSCVHPKFTTLGMAAGSGTSTAKDMAQFVLWLLNRGELNGERLLTDASFADFTNFDNYRIHPDAGGIGRALIEVSVGGQKSWWHNGGLPGFASSLYVFPESGIGIFYSVAGTPNDAFEFRLSNILLSVGSPLSPGTIEGLRRYGRLPSKFVETFLTLESEDSDPSKQNPAKKSAVETHDDTAFDLAGNYTSVRPTSHTFLVKLLRLAGTIHVQALSPDRLRTPMGTYARTGSLRYTNVEKEEQTLVFRMSESGTFLTGASSSLGALERQPWHRSPAIVLVPVIVSVVVMLTSLALMLPKFRGPRRRTAGLGLLGLVLFLTGLACELEYGAWYRFVDATSVLPGLWRLVIAVGIGLLLSAAISTVRNLASGLYKADWRTWFGKGHAAVSALACIIISVGFAYWSLVL